MSKTEVKEKLVKVEVIVPVVTYAGKPLKKGDSIEVTEAMAKLLVKHGFELEGEK